MTSAWKILERAEAERNRVQKSRLRELVLGAYAPREPRLMEGLFRFLQVEERYPLELAHRIIDRLAGMTISTVVVTHREILEFIEAMPDGYTIARGPCACRLHTADALGPDARDLAAGNLELHRRSPLEVDIQIGLSGAKFGALPSYDIISREELVRLEKECHNLGLVSNIYMMLGGETGICHCSSATCVPLIASRAIQGKTAVIKRGRLVARTDPARCERSGRCVKVCHFQARSLTPANELVVDPSRCFGCGLCADVCPSGAISMAPRGDRGAAGRTRTKGCCPPPV